jgi:glutamate synthase domain-containing protein 2
MANILEQIREQVNSLSPDQVRAQLAKLQEQKAKQREKSKGREKGPLSDEQKEKRKLYNRARVAKPEVKQKMKEYHQKPEVKARMKDYRLKREAKVKELIERARVLAVDDPSLASLIPKQRPAKPAETPAEAPQA